MNKSTVIKMLKAVDYVKVANWEDFVKMNESLGCHSISYSTRNDDGGWPWYIKYNGHSWDCLYDNALTGHYDVKTQMDIYDMIKAANEE